ncbi:AMP-binding protein [Streptomyces sp. SBC-4]|nr:AMP-binding protein [Streptomyces sp. SBC-4]MDV5143878.1 AMP-binding protein [Streptomyces sp. SBC-4]
MSGHPRAETGGPPAATATSDRAEGEQGPDRADGPDCADGPDGTDRADRSDGTDRADRADRSGWAELSGGPLPAPAVGTLGEALRRAARTPHGVVVIDGTGTVVRRSYAELYEDAARTAAELAAAGARPGARVILRTDRTTDLLTAFWACVLRGLVPLPVAYGSGADGLAEAVDAVGEAWLLGDEPPGPHPPGLRPLGRLDAGDRTTTGAREPFGPHEPFGQPREAGPLEPVEPQGPVGERRPDNTAVLTLTSGSGGRPKAVPLTHRQVLARAHGTALARGLGPDTRSLNRMPLDHVSGIVMFHVRDVYLGCHQVHADAGWVRADPLRWLDVAEAERIDTTWAPNRVLALLVDRLAEEPFRSWDLSRLRYVMNGGEAVKDRVVRRFVEALAPHGLSAGAVHPGWGMPETASGVVDSVFRPAAGPPRRHVPVGTPQPGVSVRVVDGAGRVVQAGVVGRLQVTGAPVADTYLVGGVPRPAPLSDDGWLVTDDLAFVADGELTVTGRADGLIEAGGARWHGHEIEDVVEELPCVLPSFTVARPYLTDATDGTGSAGLTVLFRPRPGVSPDEAAERVRERVRLRFGAGQVRAEAITEALPEALTEHEPPRTATGKLRRSVLAARRPGTPG